jgi:type IV pilus assembly protein PilC
VSVRFLGRFGTPDGRVIEESIEAVSEKAARASLEGRGYHVFELRRRGLPSNFGLSFEGLRRRRVPDRQFLIFNQELAGLLRAGLPLLQALDILLERQPDALFRGVLSDVRDRVRSGEELSEAFGVHGHMFPALYPSTLKAGERSGELEQVIRRFLRYLRLVMQTKRRVVSALVYPVVLVGLSAVMIGVMTIYVIPRFQVFYDSMDLELPVLTRMILGLSTFLRSLFTLETLPLWLGGLAVGIFLLRRNSARGGAIPEWLDLAKLRVPVVGRILQRFSLSEFCRSLATLLGGGLPLVPSLEVSVEAVGNKYLRARLRPIVPAVREGRPFHLALEETGVLSDLAIDMVKVGEATGSLDEMMANVSDFYDDEVETQLERMLSLVEPIMLVFMGLAVALLLAAMYLPLFSILGRLQ